MAENSSKELIATVENWFSKAPALPTNARHVLVNIAPWIALIFGILGVLGSLAGFGALTVLSPFAAMGGMRGVSGFGSGILAALVWLASSALMLAAFPGLKSRSLKGWTLLFWSEVVSFVGSLVALSIVSGIVGALIAFYILFQIKSYYK